MTLKSTNSTNIIVSVVLLLGIGLGTYFYFTAPGPVESDEQRIERLREELKGRVAEYIDLRLESDWFRLYEMTDPRHRKIIDRDKYLGAYGKNVLKVLDMKLLDSGIDATGTEAVTKIEIVAEIQIDKLPPQFRESMRSSSPEERRQSQVMDLKWQRRDGVWYNEMDREILTGRTSDGREVQQSGVFPPRPK